MTARPTPIQTMPTGRYADCGEAARIMTMAIIKYPDEREDSG